ncbi:MAG: dihydrodipicolinate synthase family protein [Anaerolineales bacterium]|nr:dihydrodipicolinate synthase family protein [Anaerolineales bacterium]
MTRLSLAGIFPPVTTPFKDNGDVDYVHLQFNLEKLNREPLRGYVIGGSNGEFTSLTNDEKLKVVQLARAVAPANRLIIAGSGMESTRATIELTQQMAKAGADAALVVTPGYFKARMTTDALVAHYRQVADASPIPIILYSVPANTGVDLPVAAVAKLAAHPNIIGLKDSGSDITKFGQMVHETPPEFQILAGSAGFFLAALAVGGVGGVMATANIAAAQLHELYTNFRVGNLEAARAVQLPLIEVNAAVTVRYGVAGLKAAMDMLGYYGGPPRPPLLPLNEDEKATLRGILVKAGLLD